ncbi:MAG: hypothetical protein KJ607_03870 [Bacteroidetes bacterium]|nr:hypothetical protein [Bacteroidota bacterium]
MIASGQGTTSITVNFGTTAGNVCVVAINTCGTSNSSCKSVTSCQSNACPKGNYYWLFGQFVGLDFSTVPPTPYKDGSQNGQEGHASICDCSTGELLFNAFGTTLWDKNHTAITTTIVGASSTHTQCHFFTPKPGSSTLIYLFTRSNTAEGYRYTLIDRTLNGGLGDIVPGQQDIQIANFAGEKQCGIRHSNNKDVWMIIGKGTTGDIYAFLVSEDGVETTPVISSPGVGFSTYGQMKASPDGSRIALSAGGTKFILYNFNRSTGAVTNPITVNASSLYGIEFSPNGQVLYTSTLTDLYQYDITSGVPATIAASKVTIATANTGRSPQLGYDGKIYTCRGGAFIGVIENPDVFGAGCNYDPEGITLDPTTQTLYVIPNHIRGDD